MITELKPNQVFVFGSNVQGFHGAGAAGYAFSGTTANDWRTDPRKQAAMKAPRGSLARVGRWAVWGVAKGLMEGIEGKGYGIVTIVRPSQKRSMPLADVLDQVVLLAYFATQHPELEFLMTPIGEGYSGYTKQEMCDGVWDKVKLPSNVTFIARNEGIGAT